MKTGNFISKAAALVVVLVGVAFAASAQKSTGFDPELKREIESRVFTIDVSQATPQRGRAISLNSGYALKLNDDSIVSDLPYYGRAYSVPFGGGEGLRFDAQITNYKLSYGKKDVANIEFNARTGEDNYTFMIKIFPNGSSYIRVLPNNKQSVAFNGNIRVQKNRAK